jgi:hypothetical protein
LAPGIFLLQDIRYWKQWFYLAHRNSFEKKVKLVFKVELNQRLSSKLYSTAALSTCEGGNIAQLAARLPRELKVGDSKQHNATKFFLVQKIA